MFIAKELNCKLKHLTLVGQNTERQLEWVGTPEQWELAEGKCNRCDGSGWVMIPDGEDDYTWDECSCNY